MEKEQHHSCIDKKLWLLAHEGVDTSEMVFPEEGRFAHGFDARAR